MRTIWHSLAWKEWHEHKWKLVSITAILCGLAALVLSFGEIRGTIALSIAFVTVGIIPLSVFIGLGAAANERSCNTLPFLQSLPVPMWRAAIAKLALGFVTLIVSIAFTLGLVWLWTSVSSVVGIDYSDAIRETKKVSIAGRWYFDFLLISSSVAASFFIWAAATGVNRKDEVSAGAVALAIMVGWCLLLVSTGYLMFGGHALPDWFFATAHSTAPAGFVFLGEPRLADFVPLGVGIAVTTHFALAIWYMRRFGRVADIEVRSPRAVARESAQSYWLPAPRKSTFTATAWKQVRESAPIALVGVAGCIGITGIAVLADAFMSGRWRTEFVGEVYPKMAVVFGMFVALVAGIGVCFNDMQPKINSFWRSRPIQPDGWFWSKFATGLVIVVASTYVPIVVLLVLDLADFNSWNFPEAFAIPVGQMAIFAAAVMTTCLVRHAVYAAILSLAVVYLGTLAGLGLWFLAGLLHLVPLNAVRWWEPSEAQVAFGMALSFITSTIIAWLAVRYDWGRKSGIEPRVYADSSPQREQGNLVGRVESARHTASKPLQVGVSR